MGYIEGQDRKQKILAIMKLAKKIFVSFGNTVLADDVQAA